MSDEQQPVHDDASGPAWERLEDQLGWYDRKSMAAQKAYNRVKLGQLIVGATVPVVAALQAAAAVTATLAAFVVVAEGAQQLYQWQTKWVLYRSTAESLKHEKYLYLAGAGPYSTADRHRVLAERLEGLISQEHAKWTESRLQDKQPSPTESKHI
ncbi:MAG: DUF4231 domain-containing protein [Pseudonocardiaceae bacterium]